MPKKEVRDFLNEKQMETYANLAAEFICSDVRRERAFKIFCQAKLQQLETEKENKCTSS